MKITKLPWHPILFFYKHKFLIIAPIRRESSKRDIVKFILMYFMVYQNLVLEVGFEPNCSKTIYAQIAAIGCQKKNLMFL
jgi:hypothetical protein